MRALLAPLILLFACHGGGTTEPRDGAIQPQVVDSVASRSEVLRYPDSTASIRGVQKFLRDSLALELVNLGLGGGRDTLIDLNGDGREDYLREWYGLAGTGVKNRVYVALASGLIGGFKPCAQLNCLGNPTFYFDRSEVCCYYVGAGGGEAIALRWNGDKLDTLMRISVGQDDVDSGLGFIHTATDFRTGRKRVHVSEQVDLPPAFKYGAYVPLIHGDRIGH